MKDKRHNLATNIAHMFGYKPELQRQVIIAEGYPDSLRIFGQKLYYCIKLNEIFKIK